MGTPGSEPAPGTAGEHLRRLPSRMRARPGEAPRSLVGQRLKEAGQPRSSWEWPERSFGAENAEPTGKAFLSRQPPLAKVTAPLAFSPGWLLCLPPALSDTYLCDPTCWQSA